MEKETSCINTRAILDYLKAHDIDYREAIRDLDPEIDALEDPEGFLRDPDSWISCGVVSRLLESAIRLLDDDEAPYKIGRFVAENTALGFGQRIVVKAFWSVKTGLKHAQKINDQWNRSKRVELTELRRNEATVRLHWDEKMETSRHLCLYNQGVYTYLPRIWGGSRLRLTEKCCYFEGAHYCEYHLRWPLRNRLHEVISRFFTSRSVLMDTIKEIEKDKKIIDQKNEALKAINKKLQVEIEEHKLAKEALRQSEERYRSLVDNTSDGYSICEIPSGRFVFLNQKICQLFRYTMKEGLNLTIWDVIDPHDHKLIRERLQARMEGRKADLASNIYTAIRKDGSKLRVEVSTSLVVYQGKPVIQGVLRDVTEGENIQLQLQQAQKMESIGTLAGGIAHDFNNLLMGIQGNASLMLLDAEHTHHHEKLKSIEQYVQSGTELTKQLLGFARGGKYEVKPTDLNDLIATSARMFGRTRKDIRIHKKLQGDLYTVKADQGQLEQVLLNLYVNAWQAMPGGGELILQTENAFLEEESVGPVGVQPGKYAKISVTDTGIGMDEGTRQRVFDPFFTTKERGRGTGLGLASAYGIIKNHGGLINVYSEQGEGTTFHIYLPCSEDEIPEQRDLDENILKGIETLLLVDDEPMILDVGAQLLNRLGYRVLVARGGQEALDIYERNKDDIALVVLDMVMPGMSGGDTYDQLKKINPSIKVLLASGYSRNGKAQAILDRGCDAFIQKPFNLPELSRKLRSVLDKK